MARGVWGRRGTLISGGIWRTANITFTWNAPIFFKFAQRLPFGLLIRLSCEIFRGKHVYTIIFMTFLTCFYRVANRMILKSLFKCAWERDGESRKFLETLAALAERHVCFVTLCFYNALFEVSTV